MFKLADESVALALAWTSSFPTHLYETSWKKHLSDLLQDGQDPTVMHC